ncbi:MAG: L,D-transpeptidase family protein [Candidatus Omnitrophica bacterium]|nr:L,D-transpeptidase family protein [Candidatus Omnitrophota bacterium]
MKNKRPIIISSIIIFIIAAVVICIPKVKGISSSKDRSSIEKSGIEVSLFSEAEMLENQGEFLKARTLYRKILEEYPDSGIVEEAQSKLNDLNIKILFSPLETEDSIFYEVKPGDTLAKIAGQHGTTVELLKKSNNLTGDIIHPGMMLKISKARYSILVDKSQNILMLKANDEILKIYNVSTGENNSTPIGTFKIINKLANPTWYKAGAIVPPDSSDNILGTRWMGLDVLSYGIHGTTDESTIGLQITQGCVRMRNKDVEELYSIVPIDTEVTIID